MPRIHPVDTVPLATDASPSTTMSTLFGIMAHRPDLMQHTKQLVETSMRSGTVDPKLKELLAIRVSQVNACFY